MTRLQRQVKKSLSLGRVGIDLCSAARHMEWTLLFRILYNRGCLKVYRWASDEWHNYLDKVVDEDDAYTCQRADELDGSWCTPT